MFRNQYDTDVTVWSPEGRLLQVEYAMESVKQGSACVGLRSDHYCVLAALKRSVSALSAPQKKLMMVDDHIAVGIAGLMADARTLVKYMQKECLTHKYVYGTAMPPHQLVADLADKHQRTTQTYVRRPFGVGLLLATVDGGTGVPHLYQTCPSGNLYEFYASAVGARSQSARTYLEKHYESLAALPADALVVHALTALQGCVSGDDDLTVKNASLVLVSKEGGVKFLEGDDLKPYLDQLEPKKVEEDDDDDDDDDDNQEGETKTDEPVAMET